MNAAPTPPRRWYQFRLSTILVLAGIAAWGGVPRQVIFVSGKTVASG